MSRTRKHKYGRKLHHKKRTVSRNKIKRKMKIKSRKIKQKFKKSHMRYAKKSMKHRIQRGGGDVENLLRAYTSSQTPEKIYQSTLIALNILGLRREQADIEYFKNIITTRRLFGLKDDTSQFLSLTEVLTIPKLDFTSEIAFLLRKDLELEIKFTRQNWIDFITHAHTVIHRQIPIIDADDIKLLNLKVGIFRSILKKAQDKHDKKQEDIYADLIAEYTAVIEANKDAHNVSYERNFFEFAPPPPVESSAIPPIPRINLELSDLARIEVNEKYLTKKNKKDVLNVKRIPNHILEKYLEYRLSDDRTGVRFGGNQEQINRFNQKIMAIEKILSGRVGGRIDINGYSQEISNGKNLFLLLHHYGLIPVYTENKDLRESDQNGRYDYVDNSICSKSVTGKDFDKTFLSSIISGKSHCRTCGRCMNKEDTSKSKEWVYKVCIQCNDLFNPSKQPLPPSSREPGGAAVSLSSPRSPSPRSPSRSSSPGAAPVTSSLRSPRRSLSPRLSSQGAAAISPDIELPP